MKQTHHSRIATYLGCDIEAYSDRTLAGTTEVFWCAFDDTGWEIASGFGGGSVEEMFKDMKIVVDCHTIAVDLLGRPEEVDEQTAEQYDDLFAFLYNRALR